MFLFPNRFAGVLALAVLVYGGWLPSQAVAAGLTLAESERIAVERDAMLREMRAQGAAMRERAVMDGQLMDPQLRVGAVNVPVDSFSLDAEDMTMLEVGVVQEFKPGQSRQLSRKQMEQLAAAMDATALDRERIVRREVRKLWTQLAYVGAARALLIEQTSWVEQMRQSAKARYASGEGRQLDMLQAGLDAAMLRDSSSTSIVTMRCTAHSCRSGSVPTRPRACSPRACHRAPNSNRSRRSRRGWPNIRRNSITCVASTLLTRRQTWRANCANPPGCSTSAMASASRRQTACPGRT
jgi:hypothetical protein